MIGELLSATRILEFDSINAEDMAKICRFTAGKSEGLRVAFVVDQRPFPLRDNLIQNFSKIYDTLIFDKVFPDPKTKDINEMYVSLSSSGNVDVIVGIGGGSTLDSAKALALLVAHADAENKDLSLDDFLGSDAKRKIEKKSIPLILIPTTAGTGSEVTKVGVYTSETGRKYTLGSPLLQAHVAILSASFTAELPASLTASTGFDALSHALESIWNKNATAQTIEAAQDAAIMILKVFEQAYDFSLEVQELSSKSTEEVQKMAFSNESLLLRMHMLKAAALAGIAFSITGTASVHALSFILSEEWHIPHGTACAFTLDDVFRMNCADAEIAMRLLPIAQAVYGESGTVEYLLTEIIRLKKKMLQPSKFSDIDVSLTCDEIREKFERSFTDPKMLNNKPPAEKEIIFKMLEGKMA